MKMNGCRLRLFSVLAGACVLCGCATVRELPPEQRKGEPETKEYRISRELLIGFINNDAGAFLKHLSPENRKGFDAEKFKKTRNEMIRSLGTPVSFTYITELEFVTFKLYVWKVRFKRIGRGKEKEPIFSEALFRVITGRSARDQVLVMGFNFL